MNLYKFTIVIPLFNKVLHIERAIKSVLSQSFQDFDLIVVDDGSTDGSASLVLSSGDSRITLIQQDNAGVSAARNRGINTARGKFIAFLDADDEWRPEHLETLNSLTERYHGAGLYATNYTFYHSNGREFAATLKGIPKNQPEGLLISYFRTAGLGHPPVCASAACVPRVIFDEVGVFPIGKRMGEDLDMWGRIALKYRVAFSNRSTVIYHLEAENRACHKFYSTDEHPFIETYAGIDKSIDTKDSRRNISIYINRLHLENAIQHAINGNYSRARKLVSGDVMSKFPLRGLLWGTRVNYLSSFIWKIKRYFSNK